jgi:glycogen operon protein
MVTALRARQVRNFLATLLLSQGVPMLTAGDELGRSQGGNNNAYCQDNATSWLSWPPSDLGRRTLELTRRLLRLRRDHPVFHYPRFLRGRAADGPRDAVWLRPDGKEMAEADWGAPEGRALGLLLGGDSLEAVDEHGEPVRDDTFLLLLSGSAGAVTFHLPPLGAHARWMPVLDTRAWEPPAELARLAGEPYALESRSLAVLRLDSGAAPPRAASAGEAGAGAPAEPAATPLAPTEPQGGP